MATPDDRPTLSMAARHSPWARLHRHSEQYLRNPCFAATSLLCITDSFQGPNCTQTILNNPNLADTCQHFLQDCPPSLLQLTTCRVVTRSTSLPCQCTAIKESSENAARLCSAAQLHILHQPEIYRKPLSQGHLAITDRSLVSMVSAIEGFHCPKINIHNAIHMKRYTQSYQACSDQNHTRKDYSLISLNN